MPCRSDYLEPNARDTFKRARRAARLVFAKHPIAALAALKHLSPEETEVYFAHALKCSNHGPYISGLTAARLAARKGRSFRHAVRSNLRAVKGRRERRALGLPTGIYSPRPLPGVQGGLA